MERAKSAVGPRTPARALKANPLNVRQQHEKQLRDLQEADGEAMLELRARKKYLALLE